MAHPRILIIEDDADIRELCRHLLEQDHFSVEACANGKEALAYLDIHQEPCLILLDMMMPVMNGKEFMTAFAKRPHTILPIPIYLVSASATAEEGKEMGCLGFIKKPFNCNALLTIVHSHCEENAVKIKNLAPPPTKIIRNKPSATQPMSTGDSQ
jgi:CheY-like chemotaxis protein